MKLYQYVWHGNRGLGADTDEQCPLAFRYMQTCMLAYLPPIGFAAAMTEQRAWRDVTIPAFDMLMLCCSMASWILTLKIYILMVKLTANIFPSYSEAEGWQYLVKESQNWLQNLLSYLSWSFILSNSSIRQIPLSARTRAPPSRVHSLVTGSLWTAAVRPTAEAPLPVVYTALCPVFSTYLPA